MICPECNTENTPPGSQCIRCGVTLPTTTLSAPAPYDPRNIPAPEIPEMPPSATSPAQAVPTFTAPPPVPAPPPDYAGQAPPSYPHQYGPPSNVVYAPPPPQPANVMDTIIPAHNPKALIGYYLAVFSIIPVLGIFLGIGGFILGFMGLKAVNKNPEIKGKAHAWIAILVGGFFGFGYLSVTAWIIVLIVLSTRH